MTSSVTDQVLSELLGRGLTYRQWRLILSGEIFNDCIGGRYFTEWQHNLGCKNFGYDKATKRRIISLELEIFRGEIVSMVQEGYTFKSIARRLRGEVWRDDGMEEREERLRIGRLLGRDARSRMLRNAVKRWKTELVTVKDIKLPNMEQGPNHIQQSSQPVPNTRNSTTYRESLTPVHIPQTFVASKSSPSFRCSFSAITTLALQNEHQSSNQTPKCWTPHEADNQSSLQQTIIKLKVRSEQSQEEMLAMKADLQSIKAGLQEHEREIAILQGGPVQRPLPPLPLQPPLPRIIDEFEEMFWQLGEEKEERCRSRRRGRVFHCDKTSTSPRPASRQGSRIPVRAATSRLDKIITESDSVLVLKTASQLPIVTKGQDDNSDQVQRHKRGTTQDRDSGYASPSSAYGSADSLIAGQMFLGAVRE